MFRNHPWNLKSRFNAANVRDYEITAEEQQKFTFPFVPMEGDPPGYSHKTQHFSGFGL